MLGNQSFNHILCLKWRTFILCIIQDGSAHVDFFQMKGNIDLKSWKSPNFSPQTADRSFTLEANTPNVYLKLSINSQHPNVSLYILHTVLYTFS